MSSKKKYNYFLVELEPGKTYWYCSLFFSDYHVGSKVIVPVSGNGTLKIGTVKAKCKFTADTVPYPVDKTKCIIRHAGLFGRYDVEKINNAINNHPYNAIDISVSSCTENGNTIRYITCQKERKIIREIYSRNHNPCPIVENYLPSSYKDIPNAAKLNLKESQERLKKLRQRDRQAVIDAANEKKRREREKFIAEEDFEDLMEDLDMYN